jgi:addiction module RelE/StbE family toxin
MADAIKINWTRQAIEDIYETREYYTHRSEKYAEQLTDKIFEKADNLKQYPQMGRMVPELERPKIRELVYKNYRIIYHVVSKDQIDILAVHNSLRPLSEDSIFD